MSGIQQSAIEDAALNLESVVTNTPLQYNRELSKRYKAHIYLKREDLQEVRSFKLRGAFHKMSSLKDADRERGVVCASAGNHAQGVAYSCHKLKIKGAIFMPTTTPQQKLGKVKKFGGSYTDIYLVGTTLDEALAAARKFEKEKGSIFVHPFDDRDVITGQGTIGKEVYETLEGKLDMIVACVGGGGLIAGIGSYIKAQNPDIQVVGAEPAGAAEMAASFSAGKVVTLDEIDTFVDGASMKTPGKISYQIAKEVVDKLLAVPEGLVAKTMIELYQNDGIVAEPAGALAVGALEMMREQIQGKRVVCTISGGNNDIMRYPEVHERSLVWQGLKHYFVINFAQKPGELRCFMEKVLGKNDDIVLFEYIKKTNRERGSALIGIELRRYEDLQPLLERMDQYHVPYTKLTPDDYLYQILI